MVSAGLSVQPSFVLGGFCGSSPQAGAARFRPVFAFLSQAFSAWPALPPHPSQQQASRKQSPECCV